MVSMPQELRVRWIDGRSEAFDPQGQPTALDATVIVDREIPIGSIMWKGKLDDLLGTAGPEDATLHQVVTVTYTPGIKARTTRRRVGLVRFRQTLPHIWE